MTSFYLARALLPKQLKDTIARRCFTSAGSSLRSRRYVLGASTNNQWSISSWPHRRQRLINPKHATLSCDATGKYAPCTRCYSMEHEPLKLVESVEDVQLTIDEVGPLVGDIDSFRDEAEKFERTIRNERGLDYKVAYAYARLGDVTKAVVKGTFTESHVKEAIYYADKAFQAVFNMNQEAVKKLGQLQEQYMEYTGRMDSLVGRLCAADGFLVDRLKTEEDLLELEEKRLRKAQNALGDAEREINRLNVRINEARKYQVWSSVVPVGGPYIIMLLENEIRAAAGKKQTHEEEVNRALETKNKCLDKVEEIRRSSESLTLLSDQLSSRKELLQFVGTSNRDVGDLVLKAKHSLMETHHHLADINALAQIAFKPSLCLPYCRIILRILLLMPSATDPNGQENELSKILILNSICESMEALPQSLFTEVETDPFDYGSEEEPLSVLFKEVRAFLRLRFAAFEHKISGNAPALLDNWGYDEKNWLALKMSIMGRD